MMETIQALTARRSIRKFADRPVDRETLEQLVQAACAAPTASNLQAWRFVMVTDADLVRKVDLVSPGLSGHPPVILVICSDLEEVARRGSAHSLEYGCMMDAAMAAENLMLRAVDLGLGTCAIKSYNEAAVRKVLRLPDTARIELLVTIGYPEGEPRCPPASPWRKCCFGTAGRRTYESDGCPGAAGLHDHQRRGIERGAPLLRPPSDDRIGAAAMRTAAAGRSG